MRDTDAFGLVDGPGGGRPRDPAEYRARAALMRMFEERPENVVFSRQLEVLLEGEFFHWVTNRALRRLAEEGVVRSENRALKTGGSIQLYWNRGYRYYRRAAARLVQLVEEYADPNIGGALGLQGEALVLEGFAREQFLMVGRETREHATRSWTESDHDLDFIFQRDGVGYGVEVKNTLSYPDHVELQTKIRMCEWLEIRPVFVARMLPKVWIEELRRAGGFALVLKYQLYPWAHRELARKVAAETGLPVDAPRSLQTGTMQRFLRWHMRNV